MSKLTMMCALVLALGTAPAFAQTASSSGLHEWEAQDAESRDARRDVRDAESDAGRSAIDTGVGVASWGLDAVSSARDLMDSYPALDTSDNAYDPNNNTSDGPQVPSQCAESAECTQCYEQAVGQLNFNRFYLNRAWSITRSYIDMAKRAEAFGDSASGIHGVAGLSWQLSGKPQIEEALAGLRRTYQNKYQIYINNLQTSLQALGQCEAKHFNERDWYGRFGFLYLNFMKAKYESPEP